MYIKRIWFTIVYIDTNLIRTVQESIPTSRKNSPLHDLTDLCVLRLRFRV